MWYFQSSCSGLFVCTAILCWDSNISRYSFFNITNCTPSPLDLKPNERLIVENKNYYNSRIQHNGFICSNCTRASFIRYKSNSTDQCHQQITMIELRNYCQDSFGYKRKKNICQCLPTDRPIQPIKDWVKAQVKPGKSHMNMIRVNNINKSASTSVYYLVVFISLLVLFGGIIGMIFYWIKLKSMQLQTFKSIK